jgi:hypothetical protein
LIRDRTIMQELDAGGTRTFLLRVRYVLGSLAAGFLVSVPAQLVLRGTDWSLLHSIAFGIVFLLGSLLLVPFTRVDWRLVALPEFKRFELSVSFYSMLLAAALQPLPFLFRAFAPNKPVFWLVFVLMGFAWGQNKFYSLIFREFYLHGTEAPGGRTGTGPS